MATYLTDRGICLRVHDFSETSQIVGMFTRVHGLVPLIAKGAKRASKKNVMSGPLDLLTLGEVVFVPARETPQAGTTRGSSGVQLGTLAGWNLDDHRRDLRANLAGLNAAMLCAEVTTHLLQPLDPHEALFDELDAALALLAFAQGPAAGRILAAYIKAALLGAGYWPQLAACVNCQRPVADVPVRFSPRAGGILCDAGRTGPGESSCYVDRATLGSTMVVPGRVALALDRLSLPAALRAAPPEKPADAGALSVAVQMLLAQVEAVTDKPMRTRYLLESLFPRG